MFRMPMRGVYLAPVAQPSPQTHALGMAFMRRAVCSAMVPSFFCFLPPRGLDGRGESYDLGALRTQELNLSSL